MKRIRILLLPLTLILLITAICGCAVCRHRDIDDNDLCDKCGEAYTDGKDMLDDPVCQHRDSDDNSLCDNCGVTYTDGKDIPDAPICQHRDSDDNSLCDKCEEAYTDGTDLTHSHSFDEWKRFNGNGDVPCDERLFHRTCETCGHLEWRNGGYEDHTFNTTTIPPTCVADGYDKKTCTTCGLVGENINFTNPIDHTYSETYASNDTHHWLECTYCGAKKDAAEHSLAQNFSCSICSWTIPTEGISYELSEDRTYAEVVGYTGTDTFVIIVSTYNGLPVKSIASGAFAMNTNITDITIPNSVTSIDDYAFYNCSNLTNVGIPDSVTSIGDYAFALCKNLSSITIPSSVTSINTGSFGYCSSLMSITIPESVKSIGEMAFYNCDNLSSITIPSSVTSINMGSFGYCSSLMSITIPESVKSIGEDAFHMCYKLAEVINYSSLDITKGSENCGYLGYYALEIHNDKSKVVNYNDYLFYTYEGVNYLIGYEGNDENLALTESYNGENYEIYKYAFYDCSNITSIVIPDSVTSIGNYAFYNCSSLTSIVIPDGVTSIGEATFADCYNLTSIFIGSGVKRIGSYAPTIPSNKGRVSSITLPSSVNVYCSTFQGCIALSCVTVDENNTAFKSIDGSLYTKDGKTLVQYAIGKTDTSFTIPEGTIIIGNYAFSECGNLTSITIPSSVTSIGDHAFYYCYNLTNVGIPDSVTSIGEGAFSGCYNLTSVEIGDSVTSIGEYAFSGCSNLMSVVIPDGVTSIGDSAFAFCDNLTSIRIPNSVEQIDAFAFSDCPNLTIYCEAESEPESWDEYWNPSNLPVIWGCKASN